MNVLRITSPQQKQRKTAEQPKRPGGDREGHSVNQENEKSAYYLTCHPECLLGVVTCASQIEMSKIVQTVDTKICKNSGAAWDRFTFEV